MEDKKESIGGLAGKLLILGLVPCSLIRYVRREHEREGDHNHSEDYLVAGGLELARIGFYIYEGIKIYQYLRR